ncbi:hypothetical protein CERSUDRAFT_99420 [Gelatoporia subvermispora B]|uniref:Uncharacterized protein n=1 Tax=Ceriporiopsis subvermispora (strain B) TaxID=914234 RepID=M2R0E9_CERS8|nr:hypothetical protein CERSUDRAFT_99420 [Gelatoporia subvermispora B]
MSQVVPVVQMMTTIYEGTAASRSSVHETGCIDDSTSHSLPELQTTRCPRPIEMRRIEGLLVAPASGISLKPDSICTPAPRSLPRLVFSHLPPHSASLSATRSPPHNLTCLTPENPATPDNLPGWHTFCPFHMSQFFERQKIGLLLLLELVLCGIPCFVAASRAESRYHARCSAAKLSELLGLVAGLEPVFVVYEVDDGLPFTLVCSSPVDVTEEHDSVAQGDSNISLTCANASSTPSDSSPGCDAQAEDAGVLSSSSVSDATAPRPASGLPSPKSAFSPSPLITAEGGVGSDVVISSRHSHTVAPLPPLISAPESLAAEPASEVLAPSLFNCATLDYGPSLPSSSSAAEDSSSFDDVIVLSLPRPSLPTSVPTPEASSAQSVPIAASLLPAPHLQAADRSCLSPFATPAGGSLDFDDVIVFSPPRPSSRHTPHPSRLPTPSLPLGESNCRSDSSMLSRTLGSPGPVILD